MTTIHPKVQAAAIAGAAVLALEAAAKVILGVDLSGPVYEVVLALSPAVAGYVRSAA